MTTGPAHWEIMFRSQSLNNQVFAVGTAPSRDPSASYTSWAHSIVTDPWGRVVNMMDESGGVYVGELDLSMVSEIRDQLPLLKHRRTDVYRLEENRS
jgi:predicted amidohydrolase